MMPKVLYLDNHLLVADKPAGMPTQPNESGESNLEDFCKSWLKEKEQKPGNVFLHAAHRLDKPVSGLVLFAKTSKALSRLNAAFRNREVEKVYVAQVEGVMPASSGTLEHYLRHDHHRAAVSHAKDPSAKLARLHYRVISCSHSQSKVEIQLETGRYHQIRAQLAAIGHPIIGDAKYGSKRAYPALGIALCHCRLSIRHPTTQAWLTFTVEEIIDRDKST